MSSGPVWAPKHTLHPHSLPLFSLPYLAYGSRLPKPSGLCTSCMAIPERQASSPGRSSAVCRGWNDNQGRRTPSVAWSQGSLSWLLPTAVWGWVLWSQSFWDGSFLNSVTVYTFSTSACGPWQPLGPASFQLSDKSTSESTSFGSART